MITSGPEARAEIISASPEAMQFSIRPGLTLVQARAVCPEIESRIASPVLEQTARETLLDVALSMAPRAKLAGRGSGLFLSEGAVFVDACGIESLHGTESLFASVFHARAERAGLKGFVSLAGSRGVARLAARHLSLAARFPRHPDQEEHPTTQILPQTARSPTSLPSPSTSSTPTTALPRPSHVSASTAYTTYYDSPAEISPLGSVPACSLSSPAPAEKKKSRLSLSPAPPPSKKPKISKPLFPASNP